MKALFKYPGGKFYLKKWILSLFPKNSQGELLDWAYIEPFGGAGNVLLEKIPAKPEFSEIYNDLDRRVANVFHCLAFKCRFQELVERLQPIEYCEAVFQENLRKQNFPLTLGDVEAAIVELVLRRMSRGGLKTAFSRSRRLRGGRNEGVNSWENFKAALPCFHNRLKNVHVMAIDAIDLIKAYAKYADIIFYCDPPYVLSTRTSKDLYTHEFDDAQHRHLAVVLQECKGKVLVSGYNCPLYEELYKGWYRYDKEIANHAAQTPLKRRCMESVWTNFPAENSCL